MRTELVRQAGGGLVEVLLVLLLLSLLVAAVMSGLMEKRAQLSAGADVDAQDLTGLLELWTSDPQNLEAPQQGDKSQREAYEDLVDQLEDRGQLDEWQELLRERLPADHPLLLALESEATDAAVESSSVAEPVEIRWADEAASDEPDDDGDPDIRWID